MKTFKLESVSSQVLRPIDLFAEDISTRFSPTISSSITGENGSKMDAHFWLPLCASTYCISKDIKDYVVVPVVSVLSCIPNTNGDSISKQELLCWDAEAGMPAYKTFKGKPTFMEHINKNISKSKGVIFDSYISPLTGYRGNRAKNVQLLAFDRSKDPKMVNMILKREVNTYSIGAYYDSYICSISGIEYTPDMAPGPHTQPGVPTYVNESGQVVFRKLKKIVGFENSCLAKSNTPAYMNSYTDDDAIITMT